MQSRMSGLCAEVEEQHTYANSFGIANAGWQESEEIGCAGTEGLQYRDASSFSEMPSNLAQVVARPCCA